jgi:hypothetical protein
MDPAIPYNEAPAGAPVRPATKRPGDRRCGGKSLRSLAGPPRVSSPLNLAPLPLHTSSCTPLLGAHPRCLATSAGEFPGATPGRAQRRF